MRIEGKKREKGNYCAEKTMANIWIFFFFREKNKNFWEHLYE